MEENKFEKQVQKKMEELEIHPSESVWEKIEVRIEKKKDPKWGLIILFLFFGILLSAGYWLWNTRQQSFSERNIVKNNFKTVPAENRKAQSKINSADKRVNENYNRTADIEEEKTHNKRTAKHYQLSRYSKANQKINSEEQTLAAFFKEKKVIAEIKSKVGSEILSGQSSEEKFADDKYSDSIQERMTSDSLLNTDFKNEVTKKSDTSKKKQVTTATIKLSKKNKWKFGISFSGGISSVGKDFLALSNPPVYSIPGFLNPGGVQSVFSSSGTKAGFGFIAEVLAEKNILKKIKFISGINFRSISTSFKLYDFAGTYYARTASNKYVNHFNFIEVPLSLKIQIGKGKNLPLSWQGGISISELISSNALQLNPSAGYYYNDNSIFNKTQIGFNTGLFVTLFSKQKNSLLIGPYFYYDASKIANEGLYDKKHFVFTGLRTEIIFGK
jgi:cytoskeletal protein RodZ